MSANILDSNFVCPRGISSWICRESWPRHQSWSSKWDNVGSGQARKEFKALLDTYRRWIEHSGSSQEHNAIQRFGHSQYMVKNDWWRCWCCWETAPSTAPYSLCYHHPSATWYSIPDPKTGAPYSLCTPRFIPRMAMLAPGNRPITTDNKLSWVKWAKKRAMKPSPTVAPIPILRFSLRNKDNEKRGTLLGAPLLFFAFSSPYSQLISLMVADEKIKGYFKMGRWGGGVSEGIPHTNIT